MSAEKLVIHTQMAPIEEIPRRYAGGVYRRIVGAGAGERTVWTYGAERDQVETEVFDVVPGMPGHVMECVEEYYIKSRLRGHTCHMGAAAMTGAGLPQSRATSLRVVGDIVRSGRIITPDALTVGAHGVIGAPFEDDSVLAVHSLVGVAAGLAIQIDDVDGPLSLVSTERAFDAYSNFDWRTETTVEPEPCGLPINLYAPQA